jgi:hypothetical protein
LQYVSQLKAEEDLSLEEFLTRSARFFKFAPEDLLLKRFAKSKKNPYIIFARDLIAYALREELKLDYHQIADLLDRSALGIQGRYYHIRKTIKGGRNERINESDAQTKV